MIRKTFGGFFRAIMLALLSFLLVGVTTALICGGAVVYYITTQIVPEATIDLTSIGMEFTSIIYAKSPDTGEWIEYERIDSDKNRIWADLDEIPLYLQKAVVAIEDKRFYQHSGVDWKRTSSAILSWVTGGEHYGGSTLTQQLIKNVTGENETSVKRKITEIFRALNLEEDLNGDKNRILELYLNTIYLGNSAYGVNTGAMTYFGKDLSELNLAECAALAGITNNPSRFNPFRYPDNVKERQETILYEMQDQGLITSAEYQAALTAPLAYVYEQYTEESNEPYSYFTDTIYRDVAQDLAAAEGISLELARLKLQSGGLRIYATIDLDVQQAMDEVYADNSNFPNASKNGKLPESAMVVSDKDGNILGIVGGRGEKTGSLTQNRATQSVRQPGSAIKPLAVYGPAMDAGLITPYSAISNSPFKVVNGNAWPRNDNRVYSGQMTIFTAIQGSTNAVAVRVLDMLGLENSFSFLTDTLEFSHLNSPDLDYAPLALGGTNGGVTVREMATGYAIFINDGVYNGSRTYTEVYDNDGNLLLDNAHKETQAFKQPQTADYMIECMQRVTAAGTATTARITGIDTAGKTGTTTSKNDNWFCGITPYYAGATWFGYDQTYDLSGISGNYATRLWTAVMKKIHQNKESASFQTGEGFVTASYCMDSGMLSTGACASDVGGSRVATGKYASGDQPTEYCTMHNYVTICSQSGLRARADCTETHNASMLDLTRRFPISVSISDSWRCYTGSNDPIGTGDVVISGGAIKTCSLDHTPSFGDWLDGILGGNENANDENGQSSSQTENQSSSGTQTSGNGSTLSQAIRDFLGQ